jgi:mRNA interferase RelE/StbE
VSIEIVWSRPALVDMRRLDQQVADRITAALERFAATGQGNVTLLTGAGGELRLRVGDWRVRFRDTIETRPAEPPATGEVRVRVLLVQRVLPRGRAYRD